MQNFFLINKLSIKINQFKLSPSHNFYFYFFFIWIALKTIQIKQNYSKIKTIYSRPKWCNGRFQQLTSFEKHLRFLHKIRNQLRHLEMKRKGNESYTFVKILSSSLQQKEESDFSSSEVFKETMCYLNIDRLRKLLKKIKFQLLNHSGYE